VVRSVRPARAADGAAGDAPGRGLITIAASGAILALKLTLGFGILALVVHLLTR
jgi:hypothetical protein